MIHSRILSLWVAQSEPNSVPPKMSPKIWLVISLTKVIGKLAVIGTLRASTPVTEKMGGSAWTNFGILPRVCRPHSILQPVFCPQLNTSMRWRSVVQKKKLEMSFPHRKILGWETRQPVKGKPPQKKVPMEVFNNIIEAKRGIDAGERENLKIAERSNLVWFQTT